MYIILVTEKPNKKIILHPWMQNSLRTIYISMYIVHYCFDSDEGSLCEQTRLYWIRQEVLC